MTQSIDTICVQGGYQPEDGGPRQVPIYQSTTWKYDTSEHMGRLFDLEEAGYFYTRLQNPTNDAVAAKLAALEGGTAGMLTSSGQAANFFAVFNITSCGDHVVASSAIYGGTFNLLAHTMHRMGIECTFVDPHCSDAELEAAFRPNTKCVLGETIANPALSVLDIERFAKAAHAHGVPLIVDNTFPTPIMCRPIEWGADIVTHSTTKYIDGHGATVGGAIIDSGKFDWTAHADKFPGLTTPDESYHGVVYTEKFGLEGAFITKCTSQLMRDFAAARVLPELQPGKPASAHASALQEWPGDGRASGEPSQDRVGASPLAAGRFRVRAGAKIPAERQLRCCELRAEGRSRCSRGVHEEPEDGRHRHACGRRAHLRAASRERHASSDERRRAGGSWYHARFGASELWYRGHRGSHRRHRPGAGGDLE